MRGIEINVVDDHIGAGDSLPFTAGVSGTVEALGSAGVDDFTMTRILHEHAGTPSRGGYALNLVENFAAVFTFIDAGTGAGIDNTGAFGIEDDRKDVGVVDDPLLDIVPVGAVVSGLPGQMPGSCVNDFGLARVDGQRLDLQRADLFGLPGGLIWSQVFP